MTTAVTEMSKAVDKEGSIERRQFIVDDGIAAVLLARVLVLERLLEETNNKLTPYQWLLAQMYPVQLLGVGPF